MKRLRSILATFLLISSLGMPSVAATAPSPRVIGGDEASISEVPWQVGLLYNRNLNNFDDQFCGGSLIHTQWVLTAAHCVVNDSNQVISANSLVVLAGADYLDPTSTDGRLAVSRIYVHPGYSASGNEDDVALLQLSRSVTLVPNVIQTISLPFQKNATAWPANGTEALVSGWGSTATDTPSYPAELMRAAVEIASDPTDEFCGDYPGYDYDRISMLCAGDIPDYLTDTCWGDSGGPLAILDGERYFLAGVTSWGYGCAEANFPGVYSRVTTYLSWIDVYVDFPAPIFSSVSPSRGSVGETVTVRGSNLNVVEEVRFGGVSAEFTVLSSTSLAVTVPVGAVTSRITLVGEIGQSVSRSNFTVVTPIPEISRLSTSRASVGDIVSVTGRNLSTVSAVTIGGVNAEIVDGSVTSTSFSFTVPVGARTNRIVVTNDFGSTTSRSSISILIPLPEISRLSTSRASVGDIVSVTGRNLSTVSAVTIGGVNAEIVDGSVTSTSFSFTVPVGARTNRIVVTNDFGSTTSRSSISILIPLPEISRLSTSRASVGDIVSVTGRNLSTVSAVTIGGVNAEIVDGSVTSTSFSFTVPVGARTNRIVVTNDFGSTTSRVTLTIR